MLGVVSGFTPSFPACRAHSHWRNLQQSVFTGIYNLPTAVDFHVANNPFIIIDDPKEMNMDSIDCFEQAKQIASTAATLDFEKNKFPDEARKIAAMCVDQLHILAEKLAGKQSGQIYL
jgi:hypothetical protein